MIIHVYSVGIDTQKSYQFGQVSVPASAVFYRTALSYAFVNRKPVLPGRILTKTLHTLHVYSMCLFNICICNTASLVYNELPEIMLFDLHLSYVIDN